MESLEEPRIAARREREKRVVSQMIGLYCSGKHADEVRDCKGFTGAQLCNDCWDLEAYALVRTDRCRMMAQKKNCESCIHHCYKPVYKDKIKQVMRYSGPRMILHHPIAVLRHLFGR